MTENQETPEAVTHTHTNSFRDWTGNKNTPFAQLGANNHSEEERPLDDFYATDPNTLEIFLNKLQEDNIKLNKNIWECACGKGHLSEVLIKRGYIVKSSDIKDRNYGTIEDFLESKKWDGDILTNPPYKYAKEFVEKSLEITSIGNKTIMLLKIQFLEGKARYKLFQNNPPKYVYVNSTRQTCYINGDMSKKISSAPCYCWYIWEKGYTGEPIIRWIKGE